MDERVVSPTAPFYWAFAFERAFPREVAMRQATSTQPITVGDCLSACERKPCKGFTLGEWMSVSTYGT